MDPLATPLRVMVSRRPRDMRAGITTLAAAVSAELGGDPRDSTLWVFLSRDLRRCKMLRFEGGCWCMRAVLNAGGAFRWRHAPSGEPAVEVDHAGLVMLLSGLDPSAAVRA